MWRKPRVFMCFLRFGRKHCAQFGAPEAHFRRFLSLGTGPKIFILNLPMLFFNPSLARHRSKMSLLGHASEAMLRHFPRPAWFEIFVLRLPKLIWTFPMADPEAHFGHFPRPGSKVIALWCVLVLNVYLRHFLGPGSKMLILKFSIFILWHFLAFSLARKCPLWDPQNSFWEFLGSLIRNIEYWSQMYVFRVFPPGCGFLACQTRFSKHVDNGPFHWSCSLAVFTVSVAFVCFLFLTMNLSWVIFAVFNDLAWKCCLCMRFSIQAHCQHRGLGSSVFWHFAFSQTCSMVIPCWQSSPCTCTFCSLEQGSQKVHRCVRASSSPRSAGASGLRFDMSCFCMLCFMVSPCI